VYFVFGSSPAFETAGNVFVLELCHKTRCHNALAVLQVCRQSEFPMYSSAWYHKYIRHMYSHTLHITMCVPCCRCVGSQNSLCSLLHDIVNIRYMYSHTLHTTMRVPYCRCVGSQKYYVLSGIMSWVSDILILTPYIPQCACHTAGV